VGAGGVVTWAGAVIADGEYVADTSVFAAETLARHAAAITPRDGAISLDALEMGGMTYTPGTYHAGGGLLVTSASVVSDSQGGVNSVRVSLPSYLLHGRCGHHYRTGERTKFGERLVGNEQCVHRCGRQCS
jgi:hypothetical protein